MKATILERPETFDRVDRVKWTVNEPVVFGDNRLWILGSPLVVDVDGQRHEVPTGFTTDGASIPEIGQILTGWDPWEPPQRWAAICHDWWYCAAGTSKRWADTAFRAVLNSEKASIWQRETMYLAVVLFGYDAYHTDQKEGAKIFE